MKKIMTVFIITLMVALVGCSSTKELTPTTTVQLDTNNSLVFSTYMASGLLSVSNTSNSNLNLSTNSTGTYRVSYLSDTTTTESDSILEIETELDEVNQYFNKLKVFMDEGVDSVLGIEEQTSTKEGYDYEITYAIEDVNYTVYYSFVDAGAEVTEDETSSEETTIEEATIVDNEDDEDNDDAEENDDQDEENNEFQLIGLMIINNVSYELTGANEIDEDEQKMWFETVDSNNGGNSVRVEIKNEDNEQKFEIETVIDGVTSEAEIKFEQEEDETKVELKLFQNGQESSYEFKKELEDNNEITYKFEYEIGEVKGEVKIIELTDSEGNVTYKYDIEEDGKRKEIEKDDDDNDEDEDEDEDTDD